MPWMVLLHTLFMSVWFGCQVALPRLFAEHSDSGEPEHQSWLCAMEQRIYFWAMTPAAVLTVLSGFWLLFSHGFTGAWLPAKLVLVTLLTFNHLYQGVLLARFRDGKNRSGRALFALQTALPLLIATPIIVLVVGKPF